MRAFLTSFAGQPIFVRTVNTHHGKGPAFPLQGTLLAVHDTHIELQTPQGTQFIALDQIVEFQPADPAHLPETIGAAAPSSAGKAIVLEWYRDLEKALKAREPEAEIRKRLGRIIHAAAKILATREDSDVAIAKERSEAVLKRCSDPALPPEE